MEHFRHGRRRRGDQWATTQTTATSTSSSSSATGSEGDKETAKERLSADVPGANQNQKKRPK